MCSRRKWTGNRGGTWETTRRGEFYIIITPILDFGSAMLILGRMALSLSVFFICILKDAAVTIPTRN